METEGTAVFSGTVLPEWIDANDHMNVAFYVLAFDMGVDSLWSEFGITDEYIEQTQGSTFAVECHVMYLRELRLDDPYLVTSQIIAFDEKRIHQFQRLYHRDQGYVAATAEWLNLHVDLRSRRVAPWPGEVMARIAQAADAQTGQRRPDGLCGKIGVPRPVYSL